MKTKPRKDDEFEDESLAYIQWVGSYTYTSWSESDRIDPELDKKKKTQIGFVDTNKKKKRR